MADETATTTETTNGAAAATTTTTAVTGDWRAAIPDTYKTDKLWEPYKDKPLGEVLKGYAEQAKLVGAKAGIQPLTDKSTPEEIAAYRAKMGVPADPSGYQIKRPEVANDGAWDESAEQGFLTLAHKLHMPPAQVQAVMDFYGEMISNQVMANQREAQTAAAALRREWGPNFDANLGRANRALQQFGGDEVVAFLQDSGLGRHPLVVKMMANVGNALVEHGAMETTSHASLGADAARERIAAIRADKSHPFNNANHPDHMTALDEMLALRRVIVGRDNQVVTQIP